MNPAFMPAPPKRINRGTWLLAFLLAFVYFAYAPAWLAKSVIAPNEKELLAAFFGGLYVLYALLSLSRCGLRRAQLAVMGTCLLVAVPAIQLFAQPSAELFITVLVTVLTFALLEYRRTGSRGDYLLLFVPLLLLPLNHPLSLAFSLIVLAMLLTSFRTQNGFTKTWPLVAALLLGAALNMWLFPLDLTLPTGTLIVVMATLLLPCAGLWLPAPQRWKRILAAALLLLSFANGLRWLALSAV